MNTAAEFNGQVRDVVVEIFSLVDVFAYTKSISIWKRVRNWRRRGAFIYVPASRDEVNI